MHLNNSKETEVLLTMNESFEWLIDTDESMMGINHGDELNELILGI